MRGAPRRATLAVVCSATALGAREHRFAVPGPDRAQVDYLRVHALLGGLHADMYLARPGDDAQVTARIEGHAALAERHWRTAGLNLALQAPELLVL